MILVPIISDKSINLKWKIMPKKVVILWQKDLQTQAKNAELMTTKKGMEPTILDPRQTLMTSQPQQT